MVRFEVLVLGGRHRQTGAIGTGLQIDGIARTGVRSLDGCTGPFVRSVGATGTDRGFPHRRLRAAWLDDYGVRRAERLRVLVAIGVEHVEHPGSIKRRELPEEHHRVAVGIKRPRRRLDPIRLATELRKPPIRARGVLSSPTIASRGTVRAATGS